MRLTMAAYTAFGLTLGLVLSHSCTNPADISQEKILSLAERSRLIECKMEALQAESEKLWDKTNEELAKALPKDIEAYEKKNMLKVRNADLIRMFETYNNLDKPIKAKVDLAEKMDFAMADSMRVLQQKQKAVTDSVRAELMTLSSDEKRQMLKEKINTIQNKSCTKISTYE
jgi:uncharacterized protein YdcH (DUF465 family)